MLLRSLCFIFKYLHGSLQERDKHVTVNKRYKRLFADEEKCEIISTQ